MTPAMNDAVPAPLPAWLSEDYANLRADGVLDLFGSIDDARAVALAPRIRSHGGFTKLVFRAEGLSDAAVAALADVGLDVEVEYAGRRHLDALLPFADRVVGMRADASATESLEGARKLSRFTSLRRLDTHLAAWDDDQLAVALETLRALDALSLRGGAFTGTGLAALPNPGALRSLDLNELGPCRITGPGIAITHEWSMLSRFTGLQSFDGALNRLQGDALGGLASAPRLLHLSLIGMKWAKPGLKFLGALGALERLNWNVAGTAKALDAAIPRLTHLRELSLLDKASDATLAALAAHCPSLKWLELQAGSVTDAGVARLAGLTALESLGVQGDGVTDACAETLSAFPALRALKVTKTSVSDAFVEAAARALPSLHGLDLARTAVTDACVDALIGIGSLHSVGLGKTKVSKKGVTRLRAARPDLHVSTYA
ncbi:MAG: serine/threonine protein kinase [Myxococcaceae bacterium]|nr:serine/threonine protein kinase [Myxococcaceae bacterium]